MTSTTSSPATLPAASRRRGFWLRQVHRWHWISSGLSLAALLLFAATGITLNHAGDIAATPVTARQAFTIGGAALGDLARAVPDGAKQPLPPRARHAIEQRLDIDLGGVVAEWSEDEVFAAMPRPGGDATLTIDRHTGAATWETTDNGWVSFLNDLHKGRNTGPVWGWFIDVFAASCVVFAATGLILLQLHARNRPSTWPIVGFGLLLPAILVLLFIHR